jgi:hypothetical protein
MIVESHGEVCRLGYLRLIVAAAKSETARDQVSLSFLASLLNESVRKLKEPAAPEVKAVGLIRSEVAARNYVAFAADLNLLSKRGHALGDNGVIYAFTRSIASYEAYLRGESDMALHDTISLKPVEQLFFLWLLITSDYLVLPGLIKWAIEAESFSRMEAMNHVMEELYPQALKTLVAAAGKKAQAEILPKIEMAQRFREERLKYSTKAEWIRSSLYAKYRHIVPPRLEWLVDLGLLRRVKRGRYTVADQILSHKPLFLKTLSYPPSKITEQVFSNLAPAMIQYAGKASREALNRELISTFNAISSYLGAPVKIRLLELAVCIRLLENNHVATPSMIRETINKLSVLYPDKIYLTPGPDDNLYLSRINLSPKELAV